MNSIILASLKPLATLVSGLGTQKKLFILIYHRVLNEPDFMRPGEVDKQAFSWQMALLAKYFNVLAFSEAFERLQTGSLPPRAVCITFDDGYADNLHNAVPILKQHNLTATFFIASGYLDGGRMWNDSVIESIKAMSKSTLDLSHLGLDQYAIASSEQKKTAAYSIINQIKHLEPDVRLHLSQQIAEYAGKLPFDLMLTSEQLKQLHAAGMEIGGHTVSHPIMLKLDKTRVQQEIVDNKTTLERILQAPIHYFAYPNGKPGEDYGLEHIDPLKKAGYQAAFSTQWGVATANSDIWQLPRFTPWDSTPIKFMQRMIFMYNATAKANL